MTGIGGDCFVLIAPKGGDKVIAYNGAGRAPAAASAEWFLDRGIGQISPDSVHSVTVPGAIEAWCRLADDHGKLGIDRLLQPAIELAAKGFPVAPRVAVGLAPQRRPPARRSGRARHPAAQGQGAERRRPHRLPRPRQGHEGDRARWRRCLLSRLDRRRHRAPPARRGQPAHPRGFRAPSRRLCRADLDRLSRHARVGMPAAGPGPDRAAAAQHPRRIAAGRGPAVRRPLPHPDRGEQAGLCRARPPHRRSRACPRAGEAPAGARACQAPRRRDRPGARHDQRAGAPAAAAPGHHLRDRGGQGPHRRQLHQLDLLQLRQRPRGAEERRACCRIAAQIS